MNKFIDGGALHRCSLWCAVFMKYVFFLIMAVFLSGCIGNSEFDAQNKSSASVQADETNLAENKTAPSAQNTINTSGQINETEAPELKIEGANDLELLLIENALNKTPETIRKKIGIIKLAVTIDDLKQLRATCNDNKTIGCFIPLAPEYKKVEVQVASYKLHATLGIINTFESTLYHEIGHVVYAYDGKKDYNLTYLKPDNRRDGEYDITEYYADRYSQEFRRDAYFVCKNETYKLERRWAAVRRNEPLQIENKCTTSIFSK